MNNKYKIELRLYKNKIYDDILNNTINMINWQI